MLILETDKTYMHPWFHPLHIGMYQNSSPSHAFAPSFCFNFPFSYFSLSYNNTLRARTGTLMDIRLVLPCDTVTVIVWQRFFCFIFQFSKGFGQVHEHILQRRHLIIARVLRSKTSIQSGIQVIIRKFKALFPLVPLRFALHLACKLRRHYVLRATRIRVQLRD